MEFTGHESPLYVGLSRVISCEWIGSGNVINMSWFQEGSPNHDIGKSISEATTVLIINITDLNWNKRRYQCSVQLTTGDIITENIFLWVKGNYTKNNGNSFKIIFIMC